MTSGSARRTSSFSAPSPASRASPEQAVTFEAPLKTRGRDAKGSDFLHRQTLRELLTWGRRAKQPQLALVVVDCDGDPARLGFVKGHLDGIRVQFLVAMAIQEFESWLIADRDMLLQVLKTAVDPPPGPIESLAPREAKTLLNRCMPDPKKAAALRRDIARSADLDVIGNHCSSFAVLLQDLGAALP